MDKLLLNKDQASQAVATVLDMFENVRGANVVMNDLIAKTAAETQVDFMATLKDNFEDLEATVTTIVTLTQNLQDALNAYIRQYDEVASDDSEFHN